MTGLLEYPYRQGQRSPLHASLVLDGSSSQARPGNGANCTYCSILVPTGACEGTLSCSTCHLVVDSQWYEKIPDPLTEEEQDMLDLAVGLTDT